MARANSGVFSLGSLSDSSFRRLNFGTDLTVLEGFSTYLFAFFDFGNFHQRVQQSRTSLIGFVRIEDRCKFDFPHHDFLQHELAVGLFERLAAGHKDRQTVVMVMEVVVDFRVVVTLRALQVDAQEQPTNVAHEKILRDCSIKIKLRGGAEFLINSVGSEDFSHQYVERFVRSE